MNTMKKTAAGTLLGGSLLVAGGLGLAHAAPPQAASVVGDGKVNVAISIGDQQLGVLQDVSLSNAEALANAVCLPGTDVAARLGELDTNQVQTLPACVSVTGGLSYTFSQNAPGNSENAPGHNRTNTMTPAPATTSVVPAPQSNAGQPQPAEGQ